jgi:hypothetical protein
VAVQPVEFAEVTLAAIDAVARPVEARAEGA